MILDLHFIRIYLDIAQKLFMLTFVALPLLIEGAAWCSTPTLVITLNHVIFSQFYRYRCVCVSAVSDVCICVRAL